MKIVNSKAERKNTYQQLCLQYEIPILSQYWWLDTVCGGNNWDVCLSFDKNGVVNGALPFFYYKKWGISMVNMPPLTSRTHLWYTMNESPKLYHRQNELQQIIENIIQGLPTNNYLNLCLQTDIQNHLPFYWSGYEQKTRYTFEVNLNQPSDYLFSQFSGKARTYIKKAEKHIKIENSHQPEDVYQIINYSFKKNQLGNPISLPLLQKIDGILAKRKQRKIYLAKDKDNSIHAAAYVIFDKKKVTYLLSGINHHLPNLGAHYLLIWQVIKDFNHSLERLDFDGSMLPNIAAIFERFGSQCLPYHQITKTSNPVLKLIQAWRNQ